MGVESRVGGDQVPELVGGIDSHGYHVVQGIAPGAEALAALGTEESVVFEHQELNLVALPGEGPAVVRPVRKEGVGLTAICAGVPQALGKEAPLVDAQSLHPERELAKGRPELAPN